MNRITELSNDVIESEFNEIRANQTAANAQFGASVAELVRDTAFTTVIATKSAGIASAGYVRRAEQARRLYSAARSLSSVRRAARVASAAQLRANYLSTGSGFVGAAAYQIAVAESPGILAIDVSIGILDELGNTRGTLGVTFGLTRGAYNAYNSSGASPEEAAAILLHQQGVFDRLARTVKTNLEAAVEKCHEN